MKSRGADAQYGPARLVQVIGNFMGGAHSLGLGQLRALDCNNGDNGTFVIDAESLKITGRQHVPGHTAARGFDESYYKKIKAAALEVNRPIFEREGS